MQKDAPKEVLLGLSFSKCLVASHLSPGRPIPLTGQQKGWEVNLWLGMIGITRALFCVNLSSLSMDVLVETVSLIFISVIFHTKPA